MSKVDTPEKRVRRGLAWIIRRGNKYGLDLGRVNLNTLDLTDPGFCLLAQAANNRYSNVIDHIRSRSDGDFGDDDWAVRHGFADEFDEQQLTVAWKAVITQLRTGPVNSSVPTSQPAAPTITPDQVLNGLDQVISSFSRTEHPELHKIRDLAVATGPRLRTYAAAIANHYRDQLVRR